MMWRKLRKQRNLCPSPRTASYLCTKILRFKYENLSDIHNYLRFNVDDFIVEILFLNKANEIIANREILCFKQCTYYLIINNKCNWKIYRGVKMEPYYATSTCRVCLQTSDCASAALVPLRRYRLSMSYNG